jgi:hypothetical protein
VNAGDASATLVGLTTGSVQFVASGAITVVAQAGPHLTTIADAQAWSIPTTTRPPRRATFEVAQNAGSVVVDSGVHSCVGACP